MVATMMITKIDTAAMRQPCTPHAIVGTRSIPLEAGSGGGAGGVESAVMGRGAGSGGLSQGPPASARTQGVGTRLPRGALAGFTPALLRLPPGSPDPRREPSGGPVNCARGAGPLIVLP